MALLRNLPVGQHRGTPKAAPGATGTQGQHGHAVKAPPNISPILIPRLSPLHQAALPHRPCTATAGGTAIRPQ